eukprot:11425904-Alexandrium_andersonii.AAC.1
MHSFTGETASGEQLHRKAPQRPDVHCRHLLAASAPYCPPVPGWLSRWLSGRKGGFVGARDLRLMLSKGHVLARLT